MYSGSCLCGAVTWRLEGSLRAARYCHCGNCRKFSGAAAAAWAMADTAGLRVTRGASDVQRFDSGRGLRCFCRHCGSVLWFESLEQPNTVAVALGSLDSGAVTPPQVHIFTASRADWDTIADALPQHAEYPGR